MSIKKIIIGITIGITTLTGWVAVLRSLVIVNPGELGLVINLGKLQDETFEEGMHVVFPLTTSVKTVDLRIQRTDVDSSARTQDLQRIETQVVLNWRIEPSKARDIYRQIGSQQQIINNIITPAFDETIKQTIPSRSLEKVLNERELLREEIATKITKRIAPYGIIVTDVAFVHLTASDEFTRSTEERQVAEQKAITAKLVAEQEIQEAELKAEKAKKEAEALVNKAQGEAQAQKLLQQNLNAELLQKQAIEKWDGHFPTFMCGNNGALPLIELSPPPTPE